jgi:hypothetical protein
MLAPFARMATAVNALHQSSRRATKGKNLCALTVLTALMAVIIGNDLSMYTIFSVYGPDDQNLSIRAVSHQSVSPSRSIRYDSIPVVIDAARTRTLTKYQLDAIRASS